MVKALQFHRIIPDFQFCGTWNKPAQFEAFVRYLETHNIRTTLPGQDDNGVIITFDDGERNVYDYAFPILKKYGIKAVVFLVVGYIGKENIWDMTVGSHAQHLSWKDILEMKEWGIEFGSHTMTHRNLTKMSEADAEYELFESKRILEKKLGTCTSISYPFNRVNRTILQKTHDAGYRYGFGGSGSDDLTIKKEAIYITDTVRSFATKVNEHPPVIYWYERTKQKVINFFTIATMLNRRGN